MTSSQVSQAVRAGRAESSRAARRLPGRQMGGQSPSLRAGERGRPVLAWEGRRRSSRRPPSVACALRGSRGSRVLDSPVSRTHTRSRPRPRSTAGGVLGGRATRRAGAWLCTPLALFVVRAGRGALRARWATTSTLLSGDVYHCVNLLPQHRSRTAPGNEEPDPGDELRRDVEDLLAVFEQALRQKPAGSVAALDPHARSGQAPEYWRIATWPAGSVVNRPEPSSFSCSSTTSIVATKTDEEAAKSELMTT
jgi:hypothetical protein